MQHVSIYDKTKWGGYENSSSDIESYNYGYDAKILELEKGANTINHYIDKLITENIKLSISFSKVLTLTPARKSDKNLIGSILCPCDFKDLTFIECPSQ